MNNVVIETVDELMDALNLVQTEKKDTDITTLRYVIYARKSTDEGDKQIRSLDDQIAECKEFAQRNKLGVVEIITESESAKNPDNRPLFKKMLNNIKTGAYDAILSWHPDRLSRNMKEAGEIIDLVDKGIIADLKFVSFTFNNDPSGKLLLGITFAMSKEYSDKLSLNVKRGNKRSILEGKYINQTKYGYYKDSEQRLMPDGENFLLIKTAFQMRRDGETLEEIAKYLKNSNLSRFEKSGDRLFVKINKQRVLKILKDPIYTGVLKYADNTAINLIEAYGFQPAVSVADFMIINRLSSGNQLFKVSKRYKKGDPIKADLARGLVICGECKNSMHSGITKKKTTKGEFINYFYYRCETKGCRLKNKSTRAKVVVDYVISFLSKKPFSNEIAYEHYVQEMSRLAKEKTHKARSEMTALIAKRTKLHERKMKIKDLFLKDSITDDTKNSFDGDISNITEEIRYIDSEIEQAKLVLSGAKDAVVTYKEYLELFDSVASFIGNIKNMSQLDMVIKKMFLNFYVKGKNVEKSTLNTPFDKLFSDRDPKVSSGGRERT